MDSTNPQAFRARSALLVSADFDARQVFLTGEVNEDTARHIMIALTIMDETPGQITLNMFSTGGCEPSGHAIYDAIRGCNNEVVIIGYGAVQSIAALILQAGTKRLLTPECRFMIHNGSIDLPSGTDADTLVAIGKEVEENNKTYHRILASRSGLSLEKVKSMCQDETYLSADAAVKNGFADAVVEPLRTFKPTLKSSRKKKS